MRVKLRSGTEIWYEFIRLYYKLLPAFTHFIKSKKHRIEVLRLLQGEVFDRREVPVLDAMRKFIHTVETTPGHAFAGVLSDISIDELKARPVSRTNSFAPLDLAGAAFPAAEES